MCLCSSLLVPLLSRGSGYRSFLPSPMVAWSSNLDHSVCGERESPSLGSLAIFLSSTPVRGASSAATPSSHHPRFLLIPTLPPSWYQSSPMLVFNTSPVIIGRTQESLLWSTLLCVSFRAICVYVLCVSLSVEKTCDFLWKRMASSRLLPQFRAVCIPLKPPIKSFAS